MASVAPRLLLLTPVTPAPTGNGLAMRAALCSLGLSRAGSLSIAVVPVAAPRPGTGQLAWLRAHSETVVVADLPSGTAAARSWIERATGRQIVAAVGDLPERARLASPAAGEAVLAELGHSDFDAIYVLRVYLVGAALPLLTAGASLHSILDADDDDAATLESIARLHEERGERAAAERARRLAGAYDRLASAAFPHFQSVVAAAPPDASSLARRHALADGVFTIPNAVPTRQPPRRAPGPDGPTRLLFVGNLDYLPNLDAAERLATSILPAVRASDPLARLDLVGAGRGATLFASSPADTRHPGVVAHGAVPDLDPLYQNATTVVAPLRAGGGSRFKLLEAFAWGVPVIASPVAAAGLDVAHERELLLATSDREFAEAVGRLAADRELARRLAATASRFVAAEHDLDRTSERLCAFVAAKLPLP